MLGQSLLKMVIIHKCGKKIRVKGPSKIQFKFKIGKKDKSKGKPPIS